MSKIFTGFTAVMAALLVVIAAAPAVAESPEDAQRERLRTLTEEVIGDVEALRGWEFKRSVEQAIQTREQLLARMEEEIDDVLPPEVLRQREAVLKLSGVVPQDVELRRSWLDMLSVGIAGFYDPEVETFYIIDDIGERYSRLPLATVIAHELTHALDDQHFGLMPLMEAVEGDADREFAVSAVIEGSATALMNRYMVRKIEERGLGIVGLALGSILSMTQETEAIEAMQRTPRYFQTFLAAYTLGQSFFYWTNMEDGQYVDRSFAEAVLQAAADPPRSSQQIIHPEKYWDPEQRVDPVEIVEDDVRQLIEALPGELQTVHAETLGELLIAIVTEPEHRFWSPFESGPGAWTNEVAERWSGDRFFVLESDEDETLRGVWVTIWESGAARDTFAETYEQHRRRPRGERRAWPLGDVAVVHTFGLSREADGLLKERMRASPPSFTRAEEPWSLPGTEEAE